MSLVQEKSLDSTDPQSVLHISERLRHNGEHHGLDDTLTFERMVCDLLVEFTNLHAEDVDRAITRAQRRIVDAADVDGMIVFEFTEGGNDFALTHSWTRGGADPPALVRSARQRFPWSHAHASASALACFASLDEIGDGAERETREHYGMRSGVVVPFSIDGQAAGAVCFTSARHPRRWPADALNRFQLIAEVLSTAIARKQSHDMLRINQERFEAIADGASVMIWMCDAHKRCTWFNRRWLQVVGRSLGDAVRQGWLDSVHPEDVESCLDVFTAAFDGRRSFNLEWRLRRNDGE